MVLLPYIALVLDWHILILLGGCPSFYLRVVLKLVLTIRMKHCNVKIVLFDEFLVDTEPCALLFLHVLDLLFTLLIVTIVSNGALPWLRLLLSSLCLMFLCCCHLLKK